MKRIFIYVYVQAVTFERGTKYKLRRSDGKRVYVSRKRLHELGDRLIYSESRKEVIA